MRTRIATILAAEDLGASGTKIIEINLKDVISRIVINFKSVYADATIAAHPAACVTKIELVDGSDVLFSLSGFQAQGINFYDRGGKAPFTYLRTYAGSARATFSIDFGRFLFDQVLAFDPNKFSNPQLKITFDETKANANSSENECEVLAHIFDEIVPTPTGFLVSKEIYSYTVGTTGYEYLDLPTDYITQQIFGKARKAPYGMEAIWDEFKLSEDNDKRIPLDHSSGELIRIAFETFGPVEEWFKAVNSANVYFYGMPVDGAFGMVTAEASLENVEVESVGGGKYYLRSDAAASYRGRGKVIGNCPHGVIPLLPKPGPEIADWWDVTKIGSLRLRIKDSAPAADTYTGEIMVKQYRPYA